MYDTQIGLVNLRFIIGLNRCPISVYTHHITTLKVHILNYLFYPLLPTI